jgi:phthiocerol/phenolphthiocerol synthesis type-I polyketide synthase E
MFESILAMTADERTALADRFAQASRLARAEPVAVVGMGCRFPGDVHGLDSYWQLLVEGRDAITEVPTDRWDAHSLYDPDPSTPGRMNTKWGGFLSDIADFDAEFFGITPREAEAMDPQQRLLLEVTWEALEHAGIAPDSLSETRTAVMMGVYYNEYRFELAANSEFIGRYWATGNAHSVTVGRISYLLGLRGPAMAIDTACSSSLVAVHEACQSLRMRESDVALAGGVSLILRPETQLALSAWGMFSPHGKCRSFDAGADGFVRGEGCGVVVLKRLTDAVRDGDRVLAVVRGSAINQDGRSNGLTAPNASSQCDLIKAALRNADVTAGSVSYVETHGTGTTLGDPIEFDALAQIYGRGDGECALGAVKTNIGHLEAAAGIAGFIKAALALRHGHIPPNLNFVDWNPVIDASGTRLFVPTTNAAWPATDRPRRAAVSSFGFGGTNAHVVLEQCPDADAAPAPESSVTTLEVSAKTPVRLATWAATLADWLEGAGAAVPLADVAETLAHRRARYPLLATISACSRAQAVDGLRALARYQSAVGVVGPQQRRGQLAAIAPPKAEAASCRLADLPTTPWRHDRFWVAGRLGVQLPRGSVLEGAPEMAPSTGEPGPQVLLLSARTAESLQEARTALAEGLSRDDELALPDVAHTLAHRRPQEHRLAAVVHDRAAAPAVLTAAEHDNVSIAKCPQGIPAGSERVAFLFPGQGAQHIGMAGGLFNTEPVFREHFDRCAAGFDDDLGIDLKEQVFAGTNLERTDLAQPALFAVEYALAQLAMSYGVQPAALAGHTIGELVAATVADVFDLPTALKVVALRARLMHATPGAAMVGVAATPEDINAHLGNDVDVAAVNDPGSCVVAGPEDAIAALTDRLAAQGILTRRLRTSHAFHSQSMDEVLPRFAEYLASVTLREPTIPLLSNITGKWMTAAEATDPERWARHIRCAVRFADEVEVLLADPYRVLVEVGPGNNLTGSAMRLPAWGNTHRAVRLTRHPLQSREDRDVFLLALGQLWSAGIDVDWTTLQGEQARRVTLPGPPFARQQHWIEPTDVQRVVTSAAGTAASASKNGADPRAHMLATLQRIWAQCLGLESVDPGDNFFGLGGDSLVAIGVVMTASREGLDLTPQDFYDHQTLAALADALVTRCASGGLASDVPADLCLPLPPNICRFLDAGLAERGRWRVPLVLRLDSRIGAADVTAVVSAVISHHDALRMRVVKRSGTWEQQITKPGEFTDLVERALPSAAAPDSVEEREALSAIVTDTVRDQDLRSLPLTATYLTDATAAARFLLLTVHQMVDDTTSREVLLTDLLTAFAQRLDGEDIALESVSTSWRDWSQRCAALSAHPAVLDRRGYWLNVAKASLRVADSSASAEPPGADDLVRLPSALTTEQTSMIDNACRLLQVGIDEILLSGLARTIAAVVGEGIIAVDLAGAGRSVLKPEVDLRRTVGWFSTIYPIALPCVKPPATGAAYLIEEIRQTVQAVPHNGIGYGVLRYLHAPTARLLEATAGSDIHLANIGMIPEREESDALVRWETDSEPAHWDTPPGLGHPIELRVYRRGGALHVDCWYDHRRVPGATIEALAERFPAMLIGLVDEAVTGHTGEGASHADDEALALVDLSAAVLEDGD